MSARPPDPSPAAPAGRRPDPRPRRSRLRRGLDWAALFVAGVLVLACGIVVWLVATTGGRDTLLAQIVARLPPGALRWESAEGVVRGPLELRGVHFAHDGIAFHAERLRLDPDLLPVLGRRLQLDRLEVDGAVLVLPPSEEAPFALPTWPDLLPQLPMPLPIDTAVLEIDGLQVRRADESLVRIARLDARDVRLRDDGFELAEARIASDRGDATLRGHYRPARRFASDLEADITLPAAAGVAPARLALRLHGDLDTLHLDLAGSAPEPFSLQATVRDGGGDAPAWNLRVQAAGLEPARLVPPAGPEGAAAGAGDPTRLRGTLDAEGRGGDIDLAGEVAIDGFVVGIDPSRLVLATDAVRAEPLALRLPQGPLALSGRLDFAGAGVVDLQLATAGLRLQPGTDPAQPPVDLAGEARVAGTLDAWQLVAAFTAERDGLRAALEARGHGDRETLALDRFVATTPEGRLEGRGDVRWAPGLAFALDARLAGFDPGFFLPDFPGRADADAWLTAARDEAGEWTADVRLDSLGGELRGRPLAGHVRAGWRRDRGEGEADLRIGASHLRAAGGFGARWDLDVTAAPLDLADLRADLAGDVSGRVNLRGPAASPVITLDLAASGLRRGDDRIDTLSARGLLPATGDQGGFLVEARGARVAGNALDSVRIAGRGSRAQLDLAVDAASPLGTVALAGDLAAVRAGWQGRLDRLQLVPVRGPTLALVAPAAFRHGAGRLQLDRACLAADAGGTLCAEADGDTVRVAGDALPLALLQPWLPADTGVALQAVGELDLQATLQSSAAGWGGTLRLTSEAAGLRLAEDLEREVFGWRDLVLDATFAADGGGRLEAELAAGLAAGGRVGASLAAGLADDAPVSGRFDLDVRDLTWLELFSEDIAVPVGTLAGQLRLEGQRDATRLSGDAHLAGFAAELPGLGLKLHSGEVRLRGAEDGSVVLGGQVTSGDGVLRLGGSLDLDDDTVPLELTLRGEDVTFASTAELYAVGAPDLSLRWLPDRLEVRGSLTVPEARIDLEALDSSATVSPDVVVVDPVDAASERSRPLDLQFQVRLGDDVRLKGFGLDGRIAGALSLSERPGRRATASGTLNVTGAYRAYGQALEITQARLGFADSPYDDPTLDIRAEREFDGVTVGVQVRGTARRPQTTITSNPAMATSEALSWLVFGRPLRTTTSGESEQLGAAALALGAGGNIVAQQLGAKLGLDEAGIAESRNLGGATLTVGKYVSPRLFVSYGVSLIGTGQVVTLKYLLTRDFDISIESGAENAASFNWRREK